LSNISVKCRVTKLPKLRAHYKPNPLFLPREGQRMSSEIRIRTLRGRGAYGPNDANRRERVHKGYSDKPSLFSIKDAPSAGRLRAYYRREKLKGLKSGGRISKSRSRARYLWLEGGYKQYRQIQGRRTDIVDHTMTGEMLNSLRVHGNARRVVITVPAGQLRKAFYTNKRRSWFYLTTDQQRGYRRRVISQVQNWHR